MKNISVVALFALAGVALAPQQTLALSCLDPDGMVSYFTEESEYMIVKASPKEQSEFVKNEADTTDPNMMYPEGYTAQLLQVEESYQGSVPATPWVYFERNGTWNYLCVGEPPKVGSDNIYVLHKDSGLFSLTQVVGVYEADSDIAKKLMSTLDDKNSGEDLEEPMVYDSPASYWLDQLYTELKEIAFMVKVKMAEWQFWMKK